MLSNKFFPYSSMQEINLDWILTKVKNILRFVPDDGAVGQILRRTRSGAEWSDEQGAGGSVTSVNGMQGAVVLDYADVGALPDTYVAPVISVNGQTGVVGLDASDVGALPDTTVIPDSTSDLVNDAGFITSAQAPVQSVNGQTGAVTLTIPDSTSDLVNDAGFITSAQAPVQSVNGQTGTVVLDASDIGAINPPDILNAQRTALTSGTALNVTSTGAWYCVAAINRNTSGECWATIADQDLNVYYAAIQNPTGNFTRALTPWLYFPAGAKFAARASFTYSDTSGLFKAQPLT